MSVIETLIEKEVVLMQLRSSVFTQNLDHLGLVAGIIKQLGIVERVDELLGANSRATKFVSVGECVAAMILNGLGFTNQALYLVSHFFSNKPVDRLLGDHLKGEYFNDDALSASLDQIAAADPTQFFANIAFPIATNRKYRRLAARLDSTTFSLEGAYDAFGGSPEEAPQIISVTHGHSKQHRPDLKQITLSMVNTGPGAIPIWSEPLSGNASDKKTFHETIARVRAFQRAIGDSEEFRWVADSALYSKEHLLKSSTNFVWVTRVPETIREAKDLTQKSDNELSWKQLPGGYKYHSTTSKFGEIEQRWLLVFSEAAYERESATLEKRIEKEKKTMEKALWHLSNEAFACEADAKKRFLEVATDFTLHQADFSVTTQAKFSKRGRPAKDAQPQNQEVKIILPEIKENLETINRLKATKGRFILATNDLDGNAFPDEEILKEYKDLAKLERGFRFLKDPWFMLDKLFLKTPNRIAALTAVMALCLLVYNVAEYEMREALKTQHKTLPNQLKKEINNPTLRWVFKLLEGISIVTMTTDKIVHSAVSNLTELTERIIRLFGHETELVYGLENSAQQRKVKKNGKK